MTDYELHLGDCLKILPTLEAGSVDAVITDPPWKEYQTGWYNASEWHSKIEFLHPEKYSGLLYRILRINGCALVWLGWDVFGLHKDEFERSGFTVKNCIVWAKPNHTAGDLTGNFAFQHEMSLFAVKGRWQIPNKRQSNLWVVGHLFSRDKRDHPTEKPVELMTRSIEATTNPGDTVLDPFMGSGTTGVACMQLGRRFIGIELRPDYYAIAERRIHEASLQMRLPLG